MPRRRASTSAMTDTPDQPRGPVQWLVTSPLIFRIPRFIRPLQTLRTRRASDPSMPVPPLPGPKRTKIIPTKSWKLLPNRRMINAIDPKRISFVDYPEMILEIAEHLPRSVTAILMACNYSLWSLLCRKVYRTITIRSLETEPKWTTDHDNKRRPRAHRFRMTIRLNIIFDGPLSNGPVPFLPNLIWLNYQNIDFWTIPLMARYSHLQPLYMRLHSETSGLPFTMVPLHPSVMCLDITNGHLEQPHSPGYLRWTWNDEVKEIISGLENGTHTRDTVTFRTWLNRLPASVQRVWVMEDYKLESLELVRGIEHVICLENEENTALRGRSVPFDKFEVVEIEVPQGSREPKYSAECEKKLQEDMDRRRKANKDKGKGKGKEKAKGKGELVMRTVPFVVEVDWPV